MQGYECEWTKVITTEENRGQTLLEFGEDSEIFHSLVWMNHSRFEKLDSINRIKAYKTAIKIGKIFAAGGCVEALYLKQKPKNIFMQDNLGSDVLKLNRINIILEKYYNYSYDFIDDVYGKISSNQNLFDQIISLGKKITENNYCYSKQEIEKYISAIELIKY